MKKTLIILLLSLLTMTVVVSALGSNYNNNYDWRVRHTMKPMLCKADINQDGIIDIVDLGILKSDYGKKVRKNPEAERSDIDGSGRVGLRDRRLQMKWLFTKTSDICQDVWSTV